MSIGGAPLAGVIERLPGRAVADDFRLPPGRFTCNDSAVVNALWTSFKSYSAFTSRQEKGLSGGIWTSVLTRREDNWLFTIM
jgi:hypothetical protein